MTFRVAHQNWADWHAFDFYVADRGARLYWILTSTWYDETEVEAERV